MTAEFRIALAGNPNSGKTTLFNALTGSRQHVGNYPGVTVEKKEGVYRLENTKINIVDLPGTYSLTAYSEEEVVARDFLIYEKPQVVVNIVDAAYDRGIEIKEERLAEYLGVPVVPIIARTGFGTQKLMEETVRQAAKKKEWKPKAISYGDDIDSTLLDLQDKITKGNFLTDTYPGR
mgnify:CR=1 FL=1